MQPQRLDTNKDGESATFSRRKAVAVAAGAAVAVGPKLTYAAPEVRRLNVNPGIAFAASGVVSSAGAQTLGLTGVLFSSAAGDPNNTAIVGGVRVTTLPDAGVGAKAPAN